MKKIKTDLFIKATADLQQQVEKELNISDPESDTAKAILDEEESETNDSEDSQGDDRRRGHPSDNEGSR